MASREPGFAGDVPVAALLAARHFAAKSDLRRWLMPVWLMPKLRLLVACDGKALIRLGLQDLGWRNPGKVGAFGIDVNGVGITGWLRKRKKGANVRVVMWKGGRYEVRLRDAADRSDWVETTAVHEDGISVVTEPGALADGGAGLVPVDDGLPHDYAMSFDGRDIKRLADATAELAGGFTRNNQADVVFEPPSKQQGSSLPITRIRLERMWTELTEATVLIVNKRR